MPGQQKEERTLSTRIHFAATAAACLIAGTSYGVVVGQVDDFEDGTLQNWTVNLLGQGGGNPVPPENIANGGPNGAGDNFMWLRAVGGNGPGGKLAVINPAQWSGNYIAAGVTGITMDVNNLGANTVHLRLLFEKVGAFGPTDVAMTSAVIVPVLSGWQTISFSVTPGSLTALQGSATAALTEATVIRIFHSAAGTFPPEPIVANIGVDNITAVPEPATLAALGAGVAVLLRRRRK